MRHLLVLLALVLPLPAWAEGRVALVIGNGAYEAVPRLPNPPADAAAMAGKLRRLGFQVTEGADLGKAAMDRIVRRFGEQAGRADVAMVFYAGHGIQVAGRNYLVPVDAKQPAREQDLRYDFVDVAGIMDELAGAKVLRIVVLDACRDNPLAAGLGRTLGRSLGTTRGLAAPTGMDNTLVAYATAADAVAEDGTGGNSPFTQALLAHIEDPGLDVRLMFGRVRDEVRRRTGNRQNPFVYASMGGENFAFNPGAAARPGDLGTPPAPAPALAEPSPGRAPAAPAGKPPPALAGLAKPFPPAPDEAPAPFQPRPRTMPDWVANLAGRWRLSPNRSCGAGGSGTLTVGDGAIRFEWRLPNGGLNVAVERIESVSGNVVQTLVVSDVGSPTPAVGHRVRYEFDADQWTSFDLTTRERGRHTRC